jgi:hypothetical protein
MKKRAKKSLRPFAWAAAGWGVVGTGWVLSSGAGGLVWMLGLWAICLLDLITLAQAVNGVLHLVTLPERGREAERATWTVRAFFWWSAKVACIAALIAVLIAGKDAPQLSLILGSSTLLVVPLVGGIWWGSRN